MTKMTKIALPLTLAVCLAGAVAHAQSDPAQPAPATPTANAMNMTPAADPATAMPPASTTGDAAGAAPPMATAPGQAQVMSSPPVPDTAANRAKYGGPMSHAGKHSSAAGN